ncbi:concanavalin A-like lectin/glucanase [Coniochaeta ligniaria NRRL 30616]|uniref:Concanavalin A-like lectin/glucanase n=1 Tax=Coniochaeta ligniaria NRRL 30616 TaxID=1408157 RepID=A0A1J7IAL5_9PEZI|nr:concanavalin A-like lectin/glucanase [Coniochaeta ligniaria NRRL 30616]
MKYFHTSFITLALMARLALSELTYTVTATKNGTPVQDSDIVLERVEPSLHRLNTTLTGPAKLKDRGRRAKRTNPTYYSSNWCGAVQHSVSTNKITSVHAYFQVPTLSQRPGVTSFPQYVATWVGIDGATWGSALLQSGVTSQLSSTGVQTNWAWLEWIPDAAYNIPSFPVATGDWIEVTVSASSSTAGSISISNLDQSTNYLIPLTNGTPLGRVDADWIVEDPATSGGPAPLARFSDTWFEDCTVSTANGTSKYVDAATMYFLSGSKCTSTQYDSSDFWASSS